MSRFRAGGLTAIMLLFLGLSPAWSASLLERGEELFLQNKPQEAVSLLEAALQENPREEKIYLYLGTAYEQLGQREKAIQILKQGLNVASSRRDTMYYNIGLNYFNLGELQAAEDMFTQATSVNSIFAQAYLNRANVRVKLEKYEDAIKDYTLYLNLAPAGRYRSQVQQMIALLKDKLHEAEMAQQAAEKQKQEAEARRKELLNSVLNSLDNAKQETTNMSAGNEDIKDYNDELDIAE